MNTVWCVFKLCIYLQFRLRLLWFVDVDDEGLTTGSWMNFSISFHFSSTVSGSMSDTLADLLKPADVLGFVCVCLTTVWGYGSGRPRDATGSWQCDCTIGANVWEVEDPEETHWFCEVNRLVGLPNCNSVRNSLLSSYSGLCTVDVEEQNLSFVQLDFGCTFHELDFGTLCSKLLKCEAEEVLPTRDGSMTVFDDTADMDVASLTILFLDMVKPDSVFTESSKSDSSMFSSASVGPVVGLNNMSFNPGSSLTDAGFQLSGDDAVDDAFRLAINDKSMLVHSNWGFKSKSESEGAKLSTLGQMLFPHSPVSEFCMSNFSCSYMNRELGLAAYAATSTLGKAWSICKL